MIEEKLADNDQESKIIMVVVVKSSPMDTFSLHDETGEFLFMEAIEEKQLLVRVRMEKMWINNKQRRMRICILDSGRLLMTMSLTEQKWASWEDS